MVLKIISADIKEAKQPVGVSSPNGSFVEQTNRPISGQLNAIDGCVYSHTVVDADHVRTRTAPSQSYDTFLGEGTSLLPVFIDQPPQKPLLDGFATNTAKYAAVFSQQSIVKKRTARVGVDTLSPAEDAMAMVHGANCATNFGGLDFTSPSQWMKETHGRIIPPAEFGKIFRQIVGLKQLPAILALFTVFTLDTLLQGYAMSVPQVSMVYAVAHFSGVSLARFGGQTSLASKIRPENVRERRAKWRMHVMKTIAGIVNASKLTIESLHRAQGLGWGRLVVARHVHREAWHGRGRVCPNLLRHP